MLWYYKPIKTFIMFVKIICQTLHDDLLITILLKKVNNSLIYRSAFQSIAFFTFKNIQGGHQKLLCSVYILPSVHKYLCLVSITAIGQSKKICCRIKCQLHTSHLLTIPLIHHYMPLQPFYHPA